MAGTPPTDGLIAPSTEPYDFTPSLSQEKIADESSHKVRSAFSEVGRALKLNLAQLEVEVRQAFIHLVELII
jgi:hypothetical protein